MRNRIFKLLVIVTSIIGSLVILLIVGTIVLGTIRIMLPFPTRTDLTPTRTPVPTVAYIPAKNTSNLQATVQIFHPFPYQQAITADQRPTIIGRISNLYTPITEVFVREGSKSPDSTIEYYEKDAVYLELVPGKLVNVRAELTNMSQGSSLAKIDTVDLYGIPENPYIPCIGYESIATLPPDSTAPCLKNWNNKLPSVLFLYKPDRDLAPGIYTFTLFADDYVRYSFRFQVNPSYQATNPFSTISPMDKDLSGDYCTSQIWEAWENIDGERANFLEIPLPHISSNQIGYKILFPQTTQETAKGMADRVAYIKFDNTIFDLILPNAYMYYRKNSAELTGWHRDMTHAHDLHIPQSLLVYHDGSRIVPADIPEHEGMIYPSSYLELLPVDAGGRTYPGETLQHFTTSSSSCDG